MGKCRVKWVRKGAFVMPLIPPELEIDPLLAALLHAESFLELSDDDTVDPDWAIEAMEHTAHYLQRMTAKQAADCKGQLDQLVKLAKKKRWPKSFVEFAQGFLENLGVETKPVKPKKRPPANKRALRRHVDIEGGDVAAVKELLEANPSLVSADLGGRERPLHYAALYGHTEIVHLLLELGAKVDPRNRYRQTPLHQAALNGHLQIARLLIEAGADVNARDCDKQTPLTQALQGGCGRKVANLLKKHGGTG
jgi:hypothetical protein